eukprot:CAMPEP_0203668402 /NCGR_PEP_ID=MMETSP0090-20130426/5035_1 /ASSEMBLY_ACC=CAM_ASM_001088 /TAXON_ID=426623 /ORGANISM="Chaetoceros affinis, Strain CCMP159" /LENGTH=592 /DNA_ID=CAMNT_0050532825 /DNA_START=755 /DNA_END=2533 /DNA_ORIENTATION=-
MNEEPTDVQDTDHCEDARSHENQQQQQRPQQEGNSDNQRKKSAIRRVLSNIDRIKRYSWRRQETNGSGILTETSISDTEWDYNIISNNSGEGDEEDSNSDSNSNQQDQINTNDDDEELDVPFIQLFLRSKGPPQIAFLAMLYAVALGATIGVVPAVLTDKYAQLYHGFNDDGGSMTCADYSMHDKPQACKDGNSDAQTAAAASSFVSNTVAFLTSSLIGSLSDEYGRRYLMVIAQCLACLSPLMLVLLQIYDKMDPSFYYIASAIGKSISWLTIALSSLSDVMPKVWRAPMFGLLLSGFSLGFALSPILALFCTHFVVSVLSLCILICSSLFSIFFLPETLPPEQAMEARMQRTEYRMRDNESVLLCTSRMILRPFKELSILNRNSFFRLLSALAFFSGMSISADQTLLLYYTEDRLDFNDQDVAKLFGIIGLFGIFVQGVLLKQITDCIGERLVVVVAFICGATTNTMYAFAQTKQVIFYAAICSTFTEMSFPTISAMKSYNVERSEQGRIQGALNALSCLSQAVGPVMLRFAYQKTMNTKYPGSFFLCATVFFIVAVFCGLKLPKDKANARRINDTGDDATPLETVEITS